MNEIVKEARSWLGTPWVHQRRDKGVAVDCAGLVIGVARACGFVAADFDVNGYPRVPNGTLLDVCDEHMTRIAKEQLSPGDVVIMSIKEDPQHMGIVGDYRYGGLSLIHAASTATPPSVVEHRLMFSTALRFVRAYRFKA